MKQNVLMKAFIKLQMLIYEWESERHMGRSYIFVFSFSIEGGISSLHNSLLLGMIS
jgi:hypothetical protein